MKRIVLLFAGAGAIALSLSSAPSRAENNEEEYSLTPVGPTDLEKFRGAIDQGDVGKPMIAPRTNKPRDNARAIYWRCDAWPVSGFGTPTYWISTSLAYSRYQAVTACSAFNGYVCAYQCSYF